MTVAEQIADYISGQAPPKRRELQLLHEAIMRAVPDCRLWFLDGKDGSGKIVSNPNIGYGFQIMQYAGGKTRDFYQVGLSANKTGISVYILGMEDKHHLARTYGKELGKAHVTGYCIKFKSLEDIDFNILNDAIRFGLAQK